MRVEANKDYVIDYTSVQSVMQCVSEMGASADGLARVYRLIDTTSYHTVHGADILAAAGISPDRQCGLDYWTRTVTLDDLLG